MFGLKKHPNDLKSTPDDSKHDIAVIPEIFYGGNDPEIYNEKAIQKKQTPSLEKSFSKDEKKNATPVQTAPPRRIPPPPLPMLESAGGSTVFQQPVASAQPVVPAQNNRQGKKIVFIFLLFVFIVGVAGAVWFLFFQNQELPDQGNQNVLPPQEQETPPIFLPPVEQTQLITTSTQDIVDTSLQTTSTISFVSSTAKERSLPPLSLIIPLDTDNDSLSNTEEEIFGTDPETLDSDTDGYYDGQEVFNLYNPKGFAPMRIIDSGLVQEYINPTWKYRLYYPVNWVATPIDARDNKDVLLSGISGDYIHIKFFEKLSGESFPGWFGRVVGDQIYTDLVSTNNRFSIPFYRRKDGLVSYFDTGTSVFAVILYSRDEDQNNIPHIADMVAQSFRIGRDNPELPPQAILPTPNSPSQTNQADTPSTTVR